MPLKLRIYNTTTISNHTITIPDASRENDGLMTSGEKAKLEDLTVGLHAQAPLMGHGTAENPLHIQEAGLDGSMFFKDATAGVFVSRTTQGRDGVGGIPVADVPVGSQVIAALFFDEKTKQLDNAIGKYFDPLIRLPNMLTQTSESDLKSVRFVLIVLRNAVPRTDDESKK